MLLRIDPKHIFFERTTDGSGKYAFFEEKKGATYGEIHPRSRRPSRDYICRCRKEPKENRQRVKASGV